MTKKGYIALAAALNRVYRDALTHDNPAQARGVLIAVYEVCDALKAERSEFDREKFLNAVRKGAA